MKTSMKLLMISSVVLTSSAFAVEVIPDARASVTVANSFDFSNPTELNFGTIRAVNASGETASMILDPQTGNRTTSSTGTNALIAPLAPGEAAVFLIENAAPGSDLFISLPSSLQLNPMNVTGGPSFTVDNFVAYLPFTNATYADPGSLLRVQPDGTATFRVGATLNTDSSVTAAAYDSDDFEGFYRVEVQY